MEVLTIFFGILSVVFFGLFIFFYFIHKRNLRILNSISHIVSNSKDDVPVIRLIDALKEMKEDLELRYSEATKSKENMRIILENVNDGIVIVNGEGKIMLSNSSVCKFMGIENCSLEGKKIVEVFENYDILNFVDKNLKNFTTDSSEFALVYPQKRYLKCDAIPVILKENEKALIIVIKDVTNERELDNFRREFISNVSHELKTPLTSIHGYAETLMDDDFKDVEMVRKFLGIIENESARMSRLINDLLDLQKLEEGKAEFKFEELDLSRVVNYVSRIVKPMTESLNVDLRISCEDHIKVYGDFDRLVQAVLNLTDNAIKYTSQKENGTKLVEVICEKIDDKSCQIRVRDTGIGIPADALSRLFERFYRVDKARSRKVGGTGLGLSIVKMIVEAHKGKVEVSSEVGKGSEFRIILPLSENVNDSDSIPA
ncbi:MAG: PAS domain-containing sensor histidine kinase [Mesoaciditoga sp.]|nr:MAG: PAS domain-containing sensor histidine kinase [Mesoaciditoga sp.]PMP80032.1 MAG: PAS domain-containing sensor histidine kinase [Mesoaciditoga sp.]